MRKSIGEAIVVVAAIVGGSAFAGSDFDNVLKSTQEGFESMKTVAKDWFKSGTFPPRENQADLDKATKNLVNVFIAGCPVFDKIAFSDASHFADTKTLSDWKLSSNAPADAHGVPGAKVRFYATWSATATAAPDVLITVSELPQRLYADGAIKDSSMDFPNLDREVKNARVGELLQALVDDWVRINAGAVAQKPAKTSLGIAQWSASASVKAEGSTKSSRADWYAWETSGVRWQVQGTTWVARVRYSKTADAKAIAKPEELLKNLVRVLQ